VTVTTKLVIAFSRQNYITLFQDQLGDPYIPRTDSIEFLIFFIYSKLHFQLPVHHTVPQSKFLSFVRTRTFSYLIIAVYSYYVLLPSYQKQSAQLLFGAALRRLRPLSLTAYSGILQRFFIFPRPLAWL
jgi:hypothetical protein